jgi:hypothetical protein
VKNVLASLVVLVVVTGVAFRIIALGRIPGINGDETYYPVVAMNVRDGRPQPLVTGSGLPLNPLYVGPLYLLHLSHPTPSFALVRLPALASGTGRRLSMRRCCRQAFPRPSPTAASDGIRVRLP